MKPETITSLLHHKLRAGIPPCVAAEASGCAWDPTDETITLPGWAVADAHTSTYYPIARTMLDAAERFVASSGYAPEPEDGTMRVRLVVSRVVIDADGAPVRDLSGDTVYVDVDPPAPPCVDGDHAWGSPHHLVGGDPMAPGLRGSDRGGIETTECCRRCGTYRVIDTGATDIQTGETMTRTRYCEPDHSALAWVASRGEGGK